MKNAFKFGFLGLALVVGVAACNNTATENEKTADSLATEIQSKVDATTDSLDSLGGAVIDSLDSLTN